MGLLALDIDGTVADKGIMFADLFPYWRLLHKRGWQIAFITGRTFSGAKDILKNIDVPYYLAVQNGVTLINMPVGDVLGERYLEKDSLASIQEISDRLGHSFVAYTGYTSGDYCYYNPDNFERLDFFLKRSVKIKEHWLPCNDFNSIERVSAIKFFDTKERLVELVEALEGIGLHAPLIKDPFTEEYYIAQMTHAEANKGSVVKFLRDILNIEDKRIIAAGNDENDIPLLSAADVRISVASDSYVLREMADINILRCTSKDVMAGIERAIELP